MYDYLRRSIPSGKPYFKEWEVAFIGIGETANNQSGAISYTKAEKVVFMTFAEFIEAIQDFKLPDDVINPFEGLFATLTNRSFNV